MAEHVESIVFHLPSGCRAEVMPTTKIPIPARVTITWSGGNAEEIVPAMIDHGAGRDVLGGTIVSAALQWPWVIKVQDWSWHETSNAHEFRLANGSLQPFTPKAVGSVRVEYNTGRNSYVLSVVVFARVHQTMQAFIENLWREPVDVSSLRLMIGVLQSLFDIVYEVCGKRQIKLTDLKASNLGVGENNQVCLLDVESARDSETRVAAGSQDYMPKSKAASGIKTFFERLRKDALESSVDSTWKTSITILEREIFDNWWKLLHEIPSPIVTALQLNGCLHSLIDEMVGSVARETFVRPPRCEARPCPLTPPPPATRTERSPSPPTPPSPPFEITVLEEINLESPASTKRQELPMQFPEHVGVKMEGDADGAGTSDHCRPRPKKILRAENDSEDPCPRPSPPLRSPAASVPPTPTGSEAEELNESVFWSVWASGFSREDKILRERCRALGIQVPVFRRMEAWARRRLPPNPECDNYQSLLSRLHNNQWHPRGGPPRETAELTEDGHFMLRCLYRQFPLAIITKPTNSSKSEDRFARAYGRKFTTFAREALAVEWVGYCWRIRRDMMLAVVRKWLATKVTATGNTFQWEGFQMNQDTFARVTEKAFAEWLAGYV